jgi:hypothetical protein
MHHVCWSGANVNRMPEQYTNTKILERFKTIAHNTLCPLWLYCSICLVNPDQECVRVSMNVDPKKGSHSCLFIIQGQWLHTVFSWVSQGGLS